MVKNNIGSVDDFIFCSQHPRRSSQFSVTPLLWNLTFYSAALGSSIHVMNIGEHMHMNIFKKLKNFCSW